MIKTFEQYIAERLRRSNGWFTRTNREEKTWADIIDDIYPGDTITVPFPEGFELECYQYKNGEQETRKFICTKLDVYQWDDDDRNDVCYYFYEPEESYKAYWGSNRWYSHTCKDHDLTKESKEKVIDYIENTPAPTEK